VTEYLRIHPGGKTSILRKAGGAQDCTEDLHFHSKKGQKLWKSYHIGKIRECPASRNDSSGKPLKWPVVLGDFFHGFMIRMHQDNHV
jgi:cytochrome b involved in lipid metabolism